MSTSLEFLFINGPHKFCTLKMPLSQHSTFQDLRNFLLSHTGLEPPFIKLFIGGHGVLDFEQYSSKKLAYVCDPSNIIPLRVQTGKKIPISVKLLSGEIETFSITDQFTVYDLKTLLKHKTGIACNQQNFNNFLRNKYSNSDKVSQLVCPFQSYVELCCELKGGSTAMVDIEAPRVLRHWSDRAPSWRRVGNGFCIEGTCMYSTCRAFKHRVYSNFYFGLFRIESVIPVCPECSNHITIYTIGFSNCIFRVRAIKTRNLKHVTIPWTLVGNHLEKWDPIQVGLVNYEYMEIETEHLKNCKTIRRGNTQIVVPMCDECAICLQELQGNGKSKSEAFKVLDCSHAYHGQCWREWEQHQKKNNRNVTCPVCRNEAR